MWFFWLLAWLAGLAGVVQSGLNRQLAEKAGLSSAIHIGNLIVLVGGVIALTLISTFNQGEFAQLVKLRLDSRTWSWWFLVPGLMGLFFITVAPFVILKLGAMKVFVAIIFGQMIGSIIWDARIEHLPIDKWRLIGGALTLLGAVAISLSKGQP